MKQKMKTKNVIVNAPNTELYYVLGDKPTAMVNGAGRIILIYCRPVIRVGARI